MIGILLLKINSLIEGSVYGRKTGRFCVEKCYVQRLLGLPIMLGHAHVSYL
jgi:hypothetical protein